MTVIRDRWGIPHIWGDTVDELAYRQGEAVARDRAGQIEVERWRSEGTLAARLGPAELSWDRFARRARLDDTARRCYDRLAPATQRWLRSYVDGVNAGLTADGPEFAFYDCTPGRWLPWSPLGVFAAQHILFGTFPNKLWRAHVTATLGPAAADLFAIEGPASSGSNAWVGAGVLAGDPHRLLELPGVYHQVRLACPEFDVVGLAFPGVPGLPHFGQAGRVAWAITNAMADYQDLYAEELRREDGLLLVREASGWVPASVHSELIEVRGHPPVPVEVVETPRGPVIDDTGLSLRTPSRVEASLGFDALLPLLRARSVDDVVAALRDWVEPVNSVLVADDTGAMRRLAAGLVPIRHDAARHRTVPAWDPTFQWQSGYEPLAVEVVTGRAVIANDRRPDVAALGVDFAPPHRGQRIAELLAGGATPETVRTDDQAGSRVLRDLLDRIDASTLDARAQDTLEQVRTWDGRMAADSDGAGAFAAWRAELARQLLDHPALRPLQAPTGFDELFAPWTDPLTRVGHALDGLVAGLGIDVVPSAVAALGHRGPDSTWGERHRLAPIHLSADPTTVTAVTGLRVALSGDSGCVLATSSTPGVSDACWRGPVARYVWDLTDRTRSRWAVPFGTSGRPGDPHFADQLPLWTNGELIPIETDWRRLAGSFAHGRCSLTPLEPTRDAELLHGWVTRRGNRFWGMADHTVEEVREVYTFLDGLSTHHAYLIRLEDAPIGIFQTYEPEHDPVGERYPVRPGDVGMHALVAPNRGIRSHGLVDELSVLFGRFLFLDPTARRIVVEPDVRNAFALRRLRTHGFTLGEEIELNGKRAQLAFLTRARFEAGQMRGRPDADRPLPNGYTRGV